MNESLYVDGVPADELLERIKSFLENNEGSHTSLRITKALNLPSNGTNRVIREAVRLLNLQGHPIVSDNTGFHWAHSDEELIDYARSLENRSNELQLRARKIREIAGDKPTVQTDPFKKYYRNVGTGLCGSCGCDIGLDDSLCGHCKAFIRIQLSKQGAQL